MRNSLLLVLLFTSSCNIFVDSFYKTSHEWDIDVLPLIKPYRLITPIPGSSHWTLNLTRDMYIEGGYIYQLNVCKVNIENRIIYGHCMPEDCFPNYYFVLIPDEDIEKGFILESEWAEYLKGRKVNSSKLHNVLTVYDQFNHSNCRSLPWYEQIKNE